MLQRVENVQGIFCILSFLPIVVFLQVLFNPVLADFNLFALLRVSKLTWPFISGNVVHARSHLLELFLLRTAVKSWPQPIVVIQEYCEVALLLFKVIRDALTWSQLTFHLRRCTVNFCML